MAAYKLPSLHSNVSVCRLFIGLLGKLDEMPSASTLEIKEAIRNGISGSLPLVRSINARGIRKADDEFPSGELEEMLKSGNDVQILQIWMPDHETIL